MFKGPSIPIYEKVTKQKQKKYEKSNMTPSKFHNSAIIVSTILKLLKRWTKSAKF
jgi:hypothetical protein